MKYAVDGWMLLGKEQRKFHKEVEAENQKRALEKVYAELGSNHRLNRKEIKIESVKEVG
ncbi:MAG: 50S ribosomal protein L18Ae [Candidatus Micrarchaeota archaeon]|nr:50S ribosomal protein L18Ae [Candidatus Micrarchaeota archaeon]